MPYPPGSRGRPMSGKEFRDNLKYMWDLQKKTMHINQIANFKYTSEKNIIAGTGKISLFF